MNTEFSRELIKRNEFGVSRMVYIGDSTAPGGFDLELADKSGVAIDVGDAIPESSQKPLLNVHHSYRRTIDMAAGHLATVLVNFIVLPVTAKVPASVPTDPHVARSHPSEWEGLRHPDLRATAFDPASEAVAILDTWRGSFSYVQENPEQDIKGLRKQQSTGCAHRSRHRNECSAWLDLRSCWATFRHVSTPGRMIARGGPGFGRAACSL